MSGRSIRGLFLLSCFIVLIALPAEGQRRRATRSAPGGLPTGQCHTFAFPKAGTKATYVTASPQGNVNFTVTYISSSATQTKTTQAVTTPQGSADVETTIDTETIGSLQATKRILTLTSTTVPVFGKLTTEVEITFAPSLTIGPSGGWCTGAKWTIPPVTQTIVTRAPLAPPQTTIVTTFQSEGEVLAVGESITVPAGTFSTVKSKGTTSSGDTVSPAISWMSMEHNVSVRQDTLDAQGNVTSTTELTAFQPGSSAIIGKEVSLDW
ncbi:MAG TPA: hypothetical protein VF701_14000 [Thermoanaerobaculia bacterium]